MRNWRRFLILIGKPVGLGACVGLIAFALFTALNFYSLGRDIPRAESQIASAFAAGDLDVSDYAPGNTKKGYHQYNDCLILWQVIDQRGTVAELTVSPLKQYPETRPHYCEALRDFVADGPPDGRVFYHRYVHGQTTALRYLLPHFSIKLLREGLRALLCLIVGTGLAVSMIGLVRGNSNSLVFVIIFAVFARFFGLEMFGQSLGHGFSDSVNMSYLVFLALAAARQGITESAAVLSASIFGALVAIFELLTGGIHLGLASVVGALPFALKCGSRPLPIVLKAAAAFCAAAAACLAVKWLLVMLSFGFDAFSSSAQHFSEDLTLTGMMTDDWRADLVPIMRRLGHSLEGLASGMIVLTYFTLALAIASGVWGARQLLRSMTLQREQTLAVLASNALLLLLLVILLRHTLVHPDLMSRVLAWVIASGFVLFALAVRSVSPATPDRTRYGSQS